MATTAGYGAGVPTLSVVRAESATKPPDRPQRLRASVSPGALGYRGVFRLLVVVALVAAACSGGGDGDGGRAEPTREFESTDAAPLPAALTEVAGATFGGRIVVVGGLDAEGAAVDAVYLYDIESEKWSEGPRLPAPVHHTSVVAARDRVWTIGGFVNKPDGGWIESAAVWSLGEGEDEWRDEPDLPAPRGALGSAATEDGTIVSFGGVSLGAVVGTTEVLRPGASAWEAGPALAESREHLAATVIDGRVYAIAGRVGSLESNKRTVESWQPSGREGSWRREPSLNDTRGGTSAAGRCVAGGEEPAGTIASVECLSDDGDEWRVVARLRHARHGLAVVDDDANGLHVIAGGDKPGLFVTATHEVIGERA